MVAAATAVLANVLSDGNHSMRPVSVQSEWQTMNGDPGAAQSTPQRIDTQIASGGADLIPLQMAGLGTSVQACLKYDPSDSHTTTSGPVVWLVGMTLAGVVQRLYDADGEKEWTFTPDSGNDVASGAAAYYSAPINVDACGCYKVWAIVKTAAVGTAFAKVNGAAILGRVL